MCYGSGIKMPKTKRSDLVHRERGVCYPCIGAVVALLVAVAIVIFT